ncbi:MAG: hypothetical protein LBR38_01875 [Synergistaceae bacterium]|nr:hypothetical protein [Synergistaceae bacterium]
MYKTLHLLGHVWLVQRVQQGRVVVVDQHGHVPVPVVQLAQQLADRLAGVLPREC